MNASIKSNIIEWNASNWITVMLMIVIGSVAVSVLETLPQQLKERRFLIQHMPKWLAKHDLMGE